MLSANGPRAHGHQHFKMQSLSPRRTITVDSNRSYLRLIDTRTQGRRYDVTPLFADGQAFARLIHDLSSRCGDLAFDVVAGIDALGFILGAAIALHTRRGFVPIRKGGKLPVAADAVRFTDYSGQEKTLELRTGVIRLGTPVLLVDEWIETGAQVAAAITLIEGQGGLVAGIAGIHMDENAATRRLSERYPCRMLSGWLTAGTWTGDTNRRGRHASR